MFFRLWRSRKKIPSPIRAIAPTPPTTPPTIAPIGAEDPEDGAALVVVGPGVGDVVGDGDVDELDDELVVVVDLELELELELELVESTVGEA